MKQFEMKPLAVAVAVAMGVGMSGSALALGPAATNAAAAAGNILRLSGATAPTKAIWRNIRVLCQAGTFTVYKAGGGPTAGTQYDPGDPGFGNSFLYSCTLNAGLEQPAGTSIPWSGTDVVFSFGVNGGSASSIRAQGNPVVTGVALLTDPLSAACDATGGITTVDGDTVFTNCGSVANQQSMGGFSDVEGQLFPASVLAGQNVTLADIDILTANASQVFGVAVSGPLYRALQTAQGITSVDCTDDNLTNGAAGVVGSNDRRGVCQPSLSSTQYASIIANNSLSDVRKAAGRWTLLGAGTTQPVFACLRDNASGTQATQVNFFLGTPCAQWPTRLGNRAVQTVTTAGPNYYVVQESGTSQVLSCLNNATAAPFNALPYTASTFKIGSISTENEPENVGDGYAFVKLNGVAPNEVGDAFNRVSAFQTRYVYHNQLALHVNKNLSATITPAVPRQILEKIASDLGNPAFYAGPTQAKGVFPITSSTFPYTTNATSPQGRGGNNCRPWIF
jgi:hypothetical protein